MADYPDFVGPAYRLRAKIAAGDRCINMYPETIESGTGKHRAALVHTPGLSLFATLPASPCRAVWAGDNRLFAVGGANLYEISSGGVVTLTGGISTDGQSAKIFANSEGSQLMIITGSDVWIATGSSVVQPSYGTNTGLVNTSGFDVERVAASGEFSPTMVGTTITINAVAYIVASFIDATHIRLTTSAGSQTAVSVSWSEDVQGVSGASLDGYFIVLNPDSNTINISALNDGLTWDALDYTTRQAPDRCVALEVANENLWVFGRKTTQVYANTGNADFPFEPIQGASVDQGCWARFSIANVGNTLMWLGASDTGVGVVWQAVGYQPKRVSTYAIEYAIQQYAVSSDARAYAYQDQGHHFYVLNFPTAQATWVYDITEGQWHERAYSTGGGGLTGQLQHYHASTFEDHAHYVGSGTTGKIYKQSRDVHTDDGTAIQRLRHAPHLSDEQVWLFFTRFQLDMEMGTAASAPTVYLSISRDGGETFGAEIAITAGAAGDYTKRAIWRRLGRGRDVVFKVRTDANAPMTWVNAYIDVDKGDS